jgi:hypothetical protein
MIVEMRTYTAVPGRANEFVSLYESMGLALQKKYLGRLLGYYVTELGTLNQIVHLWGFDSLAEREARREKLDADPAWTDYKTAFAKLGAIQHQESKIMKPVSFSPQ